MKRERTHETAYGPDVESFGVLVGRVEVAHVRVGLFGSGGGPEGVLVDMGSPETVARTLVHVLG